MIGILLKLPATVANQRRIGAKMVLSQFLEQFKFQKPLTGYFGVEREYFLIDRAGRPTPRSPEFLERINDKDWTYELSACQVEHRTKPAADIAVIRDDLASGQRHGKVAADSLGLSMEAIEVGPTDMPLDVYPNDARYAEIVRKLPPDILLAASRVTGVHIHYGVSSIDEAIRIHNVFARRLDRLIEAGDGSNGERIRLYKEMAKNWKPPLYESPQHIFRVALEQGFSSRPRDCWHLVRITRHGTVELRMFGMTSDIDRILSWIGLMKEVMNAG